MLTVGVVKLSWVKAAEVVLVSRGGGGRNCKGGSVHLFGVRALEQSRWQEMWRYRYKIYIGERGLTQPPSLVSQQLIRPTW